MATEQSNKLISGLISAVIGVLIYSIVLSTVYPDLEVRLHHLWIKSPTGHTVKSLPFYQALRVVRKHDWRLVETQPKQPPLTRKQAFRRLIRWH